MNIPELIADLRSRINPAYANQRGTESYERRLCAEALEAQAAEIERWAGVEEYLAAAADGSMSRNNSENLAAELLAQIRKA